MLKAYHLQLFYIKRSGPGAWNYLNIAKMSENVFFTFFLVVLGGWGKNTSKWALGCKNAYFLKMVAPMASIINMDLINIWKKSEINFEQNRPESSLQVVTACVGAQCLWQCFFFSKSKYPHLLKKSRTTYKIDRQDTLRSTLLNCRRHCAPTHAVTTWS